MGLGGMQKVCGNCKGVGHVKVDAPVDEVVVKRKRRTPADMLMLCDTDKGL